MRQEGVLLTFIEAVHFVHENERGFTGRRHAGFGFVHRFADFLDAGEHGTDRDEGQTESIRHQTRQRGFTHTGRPPKNHGMRPMRFKRDSERLPFPQEFFLSDDFINRRRAQTFCQRNKRRIFFGFSRCSTGCHRRCHIEQVTVHTNSVF